MEVFRICKEKYSSSLQASGTANRWNKSNEYVIYTGGSRSLSTLELVVHTKEFAPLENYKVMIIWINDSSDLIQTVKESELPSNWRSELMYPQLQSRGSEWYWNEKSLVLKVPSAIIPKEYNFLINTKHSDYIPSNIKLISTEDYYWDSRLFL